MHALVFKYKNISMKRIQEHALVSDLKNVNESPLFNYV